MPNQPDRRPFLRAIPPSDRVRERLTQVQREVVQLQILLKTAEDIERADATTDESEGGTNA